MNNWFLKQLSKRIPESKTVTLDYRKIFIFPSKLGFGFIFLLVLLLILAINYQNNLMFGFTFLLLAVFAISIFTTFKQLHGLRLENLDAESVFAKQPITFRIQGVSTSGTQHESVIFEGKGCLTPCREHFTQTTHGFNLAFETKQRGHFKAERIKVSSTYPFGLIQTWSWVDLSLTAVVYPQAIKFPLESIMAEQDESGESELLLSTGDNDLAELKTYQPGDNIKHIAWKQFAKGRGLNTKHYADMGDQHHFMIDYQKVLHGGVEEKLSAMTFWVLEMENSNHEYAIRLPDFESPTGSGANHMRCCLEKIALYQL